MTALLPPLIDLFSQAWAALLGALILLGLLALLVQALRAASSTITGSRYAIAAALGTAAGISLILLFTQLGIPAAASAAAVSAGEAGSCGPLADLGAMAARMIGALAALRMLVSFARAAAASALMGAGTLSRSLLEAGEAVLGMLFASLVGPMAAHFLGVC